MCLTKGLCQVLCEVLAPVLALEEHTAIHSHHQAARGLHPVLQPQHGHQQGSGQAGAAAQYKPADGLNLQVKPKHSTSNVCRNQMAGFAGQLRGLRKADKCALGRAAGFCSIAFIPNFAAVLSKDLAVQVNYSLQLCQPALTMKRVSRGTVAGSMPRERCSTLATCDLKGELSHSASHKSAGQTKTGYVKG